MATRRSRRSHTYELRCIGVLPTGVDANTRENLRVRLRDQLEAPALLHLSKHRGHVTIDTLMQRFTRGPNVIVELIGLEPDARVREQIDAVGVIPVNVRDDDVRDIVGSNPGALEGLSGCLVVARLPLDDELVVVKAGVDEDGLPVGAA